MRFKAVVVENIGGLIDQRVALPEAPMVAFAGPNGTGKTKLLAAMVSYWAGNLPAPRSGATARASVEVEFSSHDLAAFSAFNRAMGWNDMPDPPVNVTLTVTKNPLRGVERTSDPQTATLYQFVTNEEFLRRNPALNPMYLPAERRLLPAGSGSIDLAQLAEAVAYQQTAASRNAIQNYGRLDDQEFEQFAKALCVADRLEDDPDEPAGTPLSRIEWPEFLDTVNQLLHPKKLLPLNRSHPDQLRIQLPNSETHSVPDLSSGERQALVIISRVLRAGAGHSVVLIDEPDAYLHPNLSQRLVHALERGTGDSGQLVVATHSPAVLDRIPTNSIIRLDYSAKAGPVADESGLIELHRTTGFKASALTQSELLVVTEGELDDVVLKALFPKLARASLQRANGRAGVFQRVRHLRDYRIPVLGLVDRDVAPPTVDKDLEASICVLPTADMEGAFISDDTVLEIMVNERYVRSEYRSVHALKAVRDKLFAERRESAIAELAQNDLRRTFGIKWPAARAQNPLDRLREVSSLASNPTPTDIESAIQAAADKWNQTAAEPWKVVRGKYILAEFTSTCTSWTKGSELLEAVAAKMPALAALHEFESKMDQLLSGN